MAQLFMIFFAGFLFLQGLCNLSLNRGGDQPITSESSEAVSEPIAEESTVDPMEYVLAGNEAMTQQEYIVAIDYFTQALALNDMLSVAYFQRGNAYYYMEQYRLAVAEYDLALHYDPLNAVAAYNRGNAYANMGLREEAVVSFDLATTLRAGYTEAFYERGNNNRYLENYQLSLADYTLAIKSGDYTYAYYGRALTYFVMGHYEFALHDLNIVIERMPDSYEAYMYRSNTYTMLGDEERAQADIERYEALKPH